MLFGKKLIAAEIVCWELLNPLKCTFLTNEGPSLNRNPKMLRRSSEEDELLSTFDHMSPAFPKLPTITESVKYLGPATDLKQQGQRNTMVPIPVRILVSTLFDCSVSTWTSQPQAASPHHGRIHITLALIKLCQTHQVWCCPLGKYNQQFASAAASIHVNRDHPSQN